MDLKHLKKLLELLRSQGVLQYQSQELTLMLSEMAPVQYNRKSASQLIDELEQQDSEEDPQAEIERLVDYSSRHPSEDV